MRQGLIAEWLRGIAGRGFAGALLLTVPVLVAATIGFGGAGGLSSLASGPSDAAVSDATGTLSTNRSLESLTATLPITTKGQQQAGHRTPSGGPGGTSVGQIPTNGAASPGGAAGAGIGSESGSGGGTTTTPVPPVPSVPSLDISNLMGGGSGGNGQGLVGQLLQSVGLGHK